MSKSAPELPQSRPKREPAKVSYDGRDYPMVFEPAGWRLRSRSKKHPADFRTGALNLAEAKRRAKQWFERSGTVVSRKGGGTLERLVSVYLDTPKRANKETAADNVGRLRTICRVALDKSLSEVTCREAGPLLWKTFQRKVIEGEGNEFNYATRYLENIRINAALRCACSIFQKKILHAYREEGLDVREDAGQYTKLPEPHVERRKTDDSKLLEGWTGIGKSDRPMWLAVGLARFAGLRKKELADARVIWIEVENGLVFISLFDRPADKFWTKTGKPYRAQVINPELAAYLAALREEAPASQFIIPDPPDKVRADWFTYEPQKWIRAQGIEHKTPLHKMRGLYAEHVAKITEEVVAIRLAAVREAQKNLGHTTSATTEKHYLPNAPR